MKLNDTLYHITDTAQKVTTDMKEFQDRYSNDYNQITKQLQLLKYAVIAEFSVLLILSCICIYLLS